MENASQKITILDNKHVSMWYYPEPKIIHHQFHGFMHGKPLREALNTGVTALKKYGAQKWLSDDRQNSAIPKDDQEWINTDWFPRTQAAGWKYWALIQPENAVGQLNMNRISRYFTERGVITKFFSDLAEAMIWLKNQ